MALQGERGRASFFLETGKGRAASGAQYGVRAPISYPARRTGDRRAHRFAYGTALGTLGLDDLAAKAVADRDCVFILSFARRHWAKARAM